MINDVPGAKRPFDIHTVMERVERAMQPHPKAALFELSEAGFDSLFEQLVACMISIRTRDEVTLPTARGLFAVARTPAAMLSLNVRELERLIRACSFHQRKARQILTIAMRVEAEFDGQLPCDLEVLLSFPGVGPKCANLALAVGCGQRQISVDIHVHRITNRWGYVSTRSPEATMSALEKKLPEVYWIDINRLLVPFGKVVCRGRNPRCASCPVLDMCRQVGIDG